MDSTAIQQMIKNMLAGVVRLVLVAVGTWLFKKGLLPDANGLVEYAPAVIGAAMAGLALLWSLWQKKHQVEKVQKALDAPAGTPMAVLEKKV